VEIVGRNAMDIVLMSLYDGPVAIFGIISTLEVRIIFTHCARPVTHYLISFPKFQFSKYKSVTV
jgi:hypothetical protein